MRFIDDWKAQLKHAWSLRLAALGLLWEAIGWLNDLGLLNVWNMMPGGVRQIIPPWLDQGVGTLLFGASILARFISQRKLSGGTNGQ